MSFTIDVEHSAATVAIELTGFWDAAEIASFRRDLLARLRDPRLPRDGVRLIADLTGFPVQSGAVASSFMDFLPYDAKSRIARVAVIAQNALSKLQLERFAGGGMRVFLNIDDARAWLVEPPTMPETTA